MEREKKRDKEIKQKQNKTKNVSSAERFVSFPSFDFFLSKFVETETTEVEGSELYFPHQMQQTPLTKHSFQKLLRFRISINFATFFLIHKLILRYYNRLKYNIKRQNIMCNDNFNLTVQGHWIPLRSEWSNGFLSSSVVPSKK